MNRASGNIYVHPKENLSGRLMNFLCNFAFIKNTRRFFFNRLPFLKMQSEITDVVYINWLVDYEKARAILPETVQPVKIGNQTIFTILTYRHGNLRPSILTPLKFVFASPLQTNWRLHVDKINGENYKRTVWFLKNGMGNLLYTLGTRWFSDAMLTHYPETFSFRSAENIYSIEIISGAGSSPELNLKAKPTDKLEIPKSLMEHFGSEVKMLEYICFQDFSVTEFADSQSFCLTKINLPIDVSEIVPLTVKEVSSRTIADLVGEEKPFAFLVKKVDFEMIDEKIVGKFLKQK